MVRVATWSAVSPLSGFPAARADADAAFDVAELLEALVPQAVAVPRTAAPRRTTATARQVTREVVRTVHSLGRHGAKDRMTPRTYRGHLQPVSSMDALLPKVRRITRSQPMSRRRSAARPKAANATAASLSPSSAT